MRNSQTLLTTAVLAASAQLVAAPTAAAQFGALPFDLDEINVSGHDQHPGIDFTRHPVSIYAAEGGGLATVDINDDGFIDVFFSDTEGHPNHLYINQGDGTYVESAEAYGIQEISKRRASALFFDMENDGDLDFLSCGYPSQAIPNFDLYSLYRNDGAPDYHFTDVTVSAGNFQLAFLPEPTIIGEMGGVTCGDLDGDTYLDVFCTYWNRSYGFFFDQPRLWMNADNPLPDGADPATHSPRKFEDKTLEAGLAEPIEGWQWTPTLIDVDRDGDLDLHINIDQGFDVLRLNDGTGFFGPDIANGVGINGDPPQTRSEMGVGYGDVNFDGLSDSYHTNAYEDDRFYINQYDWDEAGGIEFTDVAIGTTTNVSSFGWGAQFADFDHDTDLDLMSLAGMAVGYDNHYHENLYPQPAFPENPLSPPAFTERSEDLPDFWRPGGQADVARNLAAFDHDNDGDLDVIIGRYGSSGLVDPGIRPGASVYENTATDLGNWLQVDPRERTGSRNVVGARVYVRAGDRIMMREILGGGSSFLTQLPYRQHFGLASETEANWVCIRWFDGHHTVEVGPAANQILRVDKKAQNWTGDMNGDGVVNQEDVSLLITAVRRPGAYDGTYFGWPWQITGDMNGDSKVDADDIPLLQALVNPGP
ncbi:MAG: FG-GAP-like repeat-containing protein [Planctomycetota bacterium]